MAPCNKEQLAVFLITFFAYAAIHAMRTSWSYSKKLLQGQHGELYISNVQLGVTDTVFLLCYSFGFAFIAPLGDRYNRRRFLVAGYLVCLAGYLFYPVAYHFFGLGNVLFLIVSMGVSGLGSSVGVPGSMGILDRWFHGGHKGLIIGLWTGCQCLGNIIGFISSTIITQYLHLRWEYNFFYNGLVTLFLTIVTLYFLREEPFETDADNMGRESVPSEEQNLETPAHNFFTVFTVPKVIPYTIAFACLKASVYGLLFWFPKYVFEKGMAEYSGYIPSMIDVGTFIGGILLGYLGDRMGKRSLLLAPFIFFSCIMMLVTTLFLKSNPIPYFFVVLLIGISLGGPYNIIGSVVAIDLANQPEVKGNKKIVSTIVGFIDAIGALFSALNQLVLAHLPHTWIFVLFTIYSLIASAVLIPLTIQDYYDYMNPKNEAIAWYDRKPVRQE